MHDEMIKQAYEYGCQVALEELGLTKQAAERDPSAGDRYSGALGGTAAGGLVGSLAAAPLASRGHGRAALAAGLGATALGGGIGALATPESTGRGTAYGAGIGAGLGGVAGVLGSNAAISALGKQAPKLLAQAAEHGIKPWHGRVGGGLVGAGMGMAAGATLGGLAGLPGWFRSNSY